MHKAILAVGCLIEKDDKYLLVRQAKYGSKTGIHTKTVGHWMFPSGKVEKSETVEEALEREVLEETGGKLEKFELKQVLEAMCDEDIGILMFVYQSGSWNFAQEVTDEEVDKIEWKTIGEIKTLVSDGLIRDGYPILDLIDFCKQGRSGTLVWPLPEHVAQFVRTVI